MQNFLFLYRHKRKNILFLLKKFPKLDTDKFPKPFVLCVQLAKKPIQKMMTRMHV